MSGKEIPSSLFAPEAIGGRPEAEGKPVARASCPRFGGTEGVRYFFGVQCRPVRWWCQPAGVESEDSILNTGAK